MSLALLENGLRTHRLRNSTNEDFVKIVLVVLGSKIFSQFGEIVFILFEGIFCVCRGHICRKRRDMLCDGVD